MTARLAAVSALTNDPDNKSKLWTHRAHQQAAAMLCNGPHGPHHLRMTRVKIIDKSHRESAQGIQPRTECDCRELCIQHCCNCSVR